MYSNYMAGQPDFTCSNKVGSEMLLYRGTPSCQFRQRKKKTVTETFRETDRLIHFWCLAFSQPQRPYPAGRNTIHQTTS